VALDRLDTNTEGGITDILTAIRALDKNNNTEATPNGDIRDTGHSGQ
jgi:hypothetical protein